MKYVEFEFVRPRDYAGTKFLVEISEDEYNQYIENKTTPVRKKIDKVIAAFNRKTVHWQDRMELLRVLQVLEVNYDDDKETDNSDWEKDLDEFIAYKKSKQK